MSSSRRRRRPRSVRVAAAASAGTALVLAAAVLWHAAYAGFSDTTTARPLPTVSTGTLALTDDDAAVKLFSVTGLKPGATATRCIAVTSTGSAATVKLYGTGPRTTNGLSGHLRLTVHVGTGGSSRNCNGFAASGPAVYDGTLGAFPTGGWASGVGAWTTTGTAATGRVYQVVYTLPASTPYTTQSGTAALSLVWESRTR